MFGCRRMAYPNFVCTNPVDVYQKSLTDNDMIERRLYIAERSARQLCPEAFGGPPNANEFRKNIVLRDANGNPLIFHFHKRGNRCYLERGWREFLENKNKGPGDVVKIQKYVNGTEGIVFFIGFESELFMGALSFA